MKHHIVKLLLSLLGGFLLLMPAHAQSWQPYTTSNSGLNSNNCWYVNVRPSDGKVFTSTTTNGLNMFDGSNWSAYTTSNSGIAGNSATSTLFYGNDIWICSDVSGISRYNGSTWHIYNTSNSALPDDQIYTVGKTSTGIYWFGMRYGGLASYNGSFFTPISISANINVQYNRAHQIAIDANNRIWIGTAGGGNSQLDLTSYEEGVYLLRLATEKGTVSRRLAVVR